MSIEELIQLREEIFLILMDRCPECWETAVLKDALIALDQKLSERSDEVRALEKCLSAPAQVEPSKTQIL